MHCGHSSWYVTCPPPPTPPLPPGVQRHLADETGQPKRPRHESARNFKLHNGRRRETTKPPRGREREQTGSQRRVRRRESRAPTIQPVGGVCNYLDNCVISIVGTAERFVETTTTDGRTGRAVDVYRITILLLYRLQRRSFRRLHESRGLIHFGFYFSNGGLSYASFSDVAALRLHCASRDAHSVIQSDGRGALLSSGPTRIHPCRISVARRETRLAVRRMIFVRETIRRMFFDLRKDACALRRSRRVQGDSE